MITEENKNLLFRDLSSRFSYGVKVAYTTLPDDMPKVWDVIGLPAVGLVDIIVPGKYRFAAVPVEEIKPYLRSMSSMTDEEHGQYMEFIEWAYNDYTSTSTTCINKELLHEYMDFIYSHHLDDNNFIKKGLALEAPKGMYKIK